MIRKVWTRVLLLSLFAGTIDAQQVWVNVFVHGIMSIKPHITLGNILRFMNDKVINTRYAKEVEFIRNNPFFQRGQAMQQLGLQAIDISNLTTNNASSAIGAIFDSVSNQINTDIKNYYYTFGWSGLLSPTQRYHDSHELFLELEQLMFLFKQQGIVPSIRLIGYSHGGNVTLNLAAIKRDYYPSSTLVIDEQVLVGVPLVTETDFLVADPFFKKTYNLVSAHDRIQYVDFFSFNRLFSRKYFKSRRGFSLPSNLVQVKVKLMKPTEPTKYDESVRKALRANFEDPAIQAGYTHLLRNVSPGHIELWFFGWTPQHYRQHFLLAPLPMVVFLPYILNLVQHVESTSKPEKVVIVDIRPKDNVTIVKQHGKKKKLAKVYPFFQEEKINEFVATARAVQPTSFTENEFNEHIKQACKRADDYYHKNIKPFNKCKTISVKDIKMRKRRLFNVHFSGTD